MRTTAAAASAVTSAPPQIPQPSFDTNTTENGNSISTNSTNTGTMVNEVGGVNTATDTMSTTTCTNNNNNKNGESPSSSTVNTGENTTIDNIISNPNAVPIVPSSGSPSSGSPLSGSPSSAVPYPSTAEMLAAYSNYQLSKNSNSPMSSIIPSAQDISTTQQQMNAMDPTLSSANVAPMIRALEAAGFGQSLKDLSESTRRLAKELQDFVEKALEGIDAAEKGEDGAPSLEEAAQLQLQTARMLRQVLPTNRELLNLVHEKNWMPILVEWLNLHDRPAVQVEALLCLSNIADLCQQSFCQQQNLRDLRSGKMSIQSMASMGSMGTIGTTNAATTAATTAATAAIANMSSGTGIDTVGIPPNIPPNAATTNHVPNNINGMNINLNANGINAAAVAAAAGMGACGINMNMAGMTGPIPPSHPLASTFHDLNSSNTTSTYAATNSTTTASTSTSTTNTNTNINNIPTSFPPPTPTPSTNISNNTSNNNSSSSSTSIPNLNPPPMPSNPYTYPSFPWLHDVAQNLGLTQEELVESAATHPGAAAYLEYMNSVNNGGTMDMANAAAMEKGNAIAESLEHLKMQQQRQHQHQHQQQHQQQSTGMPELDEIDEDELIDDEDGDTTVDMNVGMNVHIDVDDDDDDDNAICIPINAPTIIHTSQPQSSSNPTTSILSTQQSTSWDGGQGSNPLGTFTLPPLPMPSSDPNTTTAINNGINMKTTPPLPGPLPTHPPTGFPPPNSTSSITTTPGTTAANANISSMMAGGGGGGFTQPIPPSSQHLLLRHADAIPTLISLLSSPNRELHEHAMWILGSIAAGESPATTATATAPGGVAPMPNIPPSSNHTINNNITNNGIVGGTGGGVPSVGIAGNTNVGGPNGDDKNVSAKEVVLAAGVMGPLLNCLDSNPNNASLQRIGSWALSNLVETKIQQGKSNKNANGPSSSSNNNSNGNGGNGGNNNGDGSTSDSNDIDVQMLIPTLKRLLSLSDEEVLSYTCWTLSHLCDGPSSNIAAVVTSRNPSDVPGGLVPRLVDLLLHSSCRVTKPALRTIGNIVCAECSEDLSGGVNSKSAPISLITDFTEVILDCDAVPRLKSLITHEYREIQKEACWTLSNIAAGTVDQIQAVIDSGAIGPLVKLVNNKSTDQEVRSEACWVVLNATSCGSDPQIEVLVSEGCVSVLGLLLEETTMVTMALEGLERVLQVEENREMARRKRAMRRIQLNESDDESLDDLSPLVSASLIEKALKKHTATPQVTKRAGRIWEQHFVSCALCRESFSKHRTADAKFCNECKCYVCSNCNCEVYHLSYQEELWAATEEKNEASKQAKKSKKQKKKEKRKNKTKVQTAGGGGASNANGASSSATSKFVEDVPTCIPVPANKLKKKKRAGENSTNTAAAASSSNADQPALLKVDANQLNQKNGADTTTNSGSDNTPEKPARGGKANNKNKNGSTNRQNDASQVEFKKFESPSTSIGSDDEDATEQHGDDAQDSYPIDFVSYLQQTGSIIALARLMDALDEGGGNHNFQLEDDLYLNPPSVLKQQSAATTS